MSFVRFIPQVNRLGKALGKPGGKRADEALRDAAALLEEIRPPCIDGLDAALAEIVSLNSNRGPLSPEALETLYRRADEIVGLAGVFGLPELGKAAFSLCELVDLSETYPVSGRAAIASHVMSLELLRGGDEVKPQERAEVLAGLSRLMAHVRAEAA